MDSGHTSQTRTVRCRLSRLGGSLGPGKALWAGSCPWGSGEPCLAGGQSRDSHGMTLEKLFLCGPPALVSTGAWQPRGWMWVLPREPGAGSPGLPWRTGCGGACDPHVLPLQVSAVLPPLQVPRAWPVSSVFCAPHSTCCLSTYWAHGTYISCNLCGVDSVLDARSLGAQIKPVPSLTGHVLLKT